MNTILPYSNINTSFVDKQHILTNITIPKKQQAILTVMLAALVTLSPFAIDTYLAAMPAMSDHFNVGMGMVELTITLYFLGFAVGNFFGGPLSDSFGRKPIALIGITLYGISAFIIPFCGKIEFVILFRIIQAFGGGFATVTANVIIRDLFSGKQVARLITIVSMMMMLAPLFAPVIGTFLLEFSGWKAIFYFLFALAITLFVLFAIAVPESREKELITKKLTPEQLFSKYKTLFSDLQVVLIMFALGFSMSGLYIFLTGASFIYIEFFGIDQSQFPIYFGANVILNILLSLLNTFLLKKHMPRQILKVGMLIQLIAGIFLFFAVRTHTPTLWAVFLCIFIFTGSLGLVFGNGTAVILNKNPKLAGSANATLGITRFLLSFIIGSLIALFHTQDLIPLGTTMLACTLIANILFTIAMNHKKFTTHQQPTHQQSTH